MLGVSLGDGDADIDVCCEGFSDYSVKRVNVLVGISRRICSVVSVAVPVSFSRDPFGCGTMSGNSCLGPYIGNIGIYR